MQIEPKAVGQKVARGGRTVAQGFAQFLLRGKVIDLAVAVVIGAAAGSAITAFVQDVFMPFLTALFTFHHPAVKYGDFAKQGISFLIIAMVVYFFVIVPSNKLVTNAYFAPPPDPATRKCPACLSEIPRAATRCAYCTSEVTPLAEENASLPPSLS